MMYGLVYRGQKAHAGQEGHLMACEPFGDHAIGIGAGFRLKVHRNNVRPKFEE